VSGPRGDGALIPRATHVDRRHHLIFSSAPSHACKKPTSFSPSFLLCILNFLPVPAVAL
jgi:hypothetical protein